MLVDELFHERLERRAVLVELGDRPLPDRLPRADVRLLVGDEVGRRHEAVLQIVDAEIGRFGQRHRAEVPCDFQPAFVRVLDGCAKLGARDLHVGLERRRAHVRPVRHLLSRIVGILERVHLKLVVRAVQIRRRGIHRRAGLLACVDLLLQVDVHQPVRVARGPHGRDTAGEIEAHEADTKLAVHVRAGRVIGVLVDHDEAGDDALAGQIDDGRAVGRLHTGGIADLRDVGVSDDDRLPLARRRTGAVDDAHVGQGHNRRIDLDEVLHGIAERRTLRGYNRGRRQRARGGRRCQMTSHCFTTIPCLTPAFFAAALNASTSVFSEAAAFCMSASVGGVRSA